jgi:hypothetical protein
MLGALGLNIGKWYAADSESPVLAHPPECQKVKYSSPFLCRVRLGESVKSNPSNVKR